VTGRLPSIHPTEDAAAVPPIAVTGLAALFTTHILRDGELVLLILKPSLWFIPLQSMLFSGVIGLFVLGGALANANAPYRVHLYLEIAVVLIAIRLMFAVLQWQARLYVLTNLRFLRLGGVFATALYDCPLRKIAVVRLVAGSRERFLRLGSIEVVPADQSRPVGVWHTVRKPRDVHDKVVAAINRAKQ
jgi:hypothetical protein